MAIATLTPKSAGLNVRNVVNLFVFTRRAHTCKYAGRERPIKGPSQVNELVFSAFETQAARLTQLLKTTMCLSHKASGVPVSLGWRCVLL